VLVSSFDMFIGLLGLAAPLMGFLLGIVVCGDSCRLTTGQRQFSRRAYVRRKWLPACLFYTALLCGIAVTENLRLYELGRTILVCMVLAGFGGGAWTIHMARRFCAFPPWDHCAHCGYNLTGNTTGVCPECGNRR
jgi:hypothetical protein